MAINRSSSANTGAFIRRLLALTALLVVVVGLAVWFGLGLVPIGRDYITLPAAGVLLLCLALEAPGLLKSGSSRRGGAGLNALAQMVLATALLVLVNLVSFGTFRRFDLTYQQDFTLPENVREQLAQLRGETDIIIHQQYVSFGQRVENKQDKYDLAAQRKIIEKVRDLAEEFQDLGPRFRVQLLDIQDDDYQKKFDRIREDSPELADAIEKSPENSIFFYSREAKKYQRLAFSDIYQLDKERSVAANDGEGNLVLNFQGPGAFARKVFNIEERKPRVAFAVVHEWLGLEGREEYGMPAVKRMLASRGFEARDVILKNKWPRPEPTVLDHDENRFEILEAQRTAINRAVKAQQEELDEFEKTKSFWSKSGLEDLNKKFALVDTVQGIIPIPLPEIDRIKKASAPNLRTAPISGDFRDRYVKLLEEETDELRSIIKKYQEKLTKATDDQTSLRVENLAEQRRISDLRAKFNRLLSDVDLLVLTRPTLFDIVVRDERIPNRAFILDDAQVAAIKDFIATGKPVLFCLGPTSEPDEGAPELGGPESIEKLVGELGVKLNKQTILFQSEIDAMADKSERTLMLGASVEVPSARFEKPASRGVPVSEGKAPSAHPIRSSLLLTARSFGSAASADLRLRHPRPVYIPVPDSKPGEMEQLDESAVFLWSSSDSHNENQPFPTEKRIPKFERPKPDDPASRTFQLVRHGPFPLGVAFEKTPPATWREGSKSDAAMPKVRFAVLGHGGAFIGENLPPAREKLFVDLSNWLLHRDDLLAKDTQTWSYPRVQLDPLQRLIYKLGGWVGLPVVFIYLGVIMWLIRRMR